MSPSKDPAAGVCPVDESTRNAWLAAQAQKREAEAAASAKEGCTSDNPTVTSNSPTAGLSTERVISTIPRALSNDSTNSETADPHTSPSGHWIYPSEAMFFRAMQRKNWNAQATDMKSVVPIHNAVNERAWAEILAWENGRGGEACGGVKLAKFEGDASKLTPKARFWSMLGYQKPFDRHDWTVDRCGKEVEYVIDFYTGRTDPRFPERPSFYLDVRPKLTPEGAWMRADKWVRSWF